MVDRDEHEKGRGIRLESLKALSRDLPTADEIVKFEKSLASESDRGMALMSAALAETGLFWAIYRRMPDLGPEIRERTFYSAGAPLSTFSSRIIVARAMGIIGPQTSKLLGQVKDIRNAFAHALKPLDFQHSRIAEDCRKLTLPPMFTTLANEKTAREKFRMTCSYLYSELFQDALRQNSQFEITLP